MAGKLTCMRVQVLSKYLGTEGNRYESYLQKDLPHYFYLKVCFFCNTTSTRRILGCSVEHYPKCLNCSKKQDSMMEKKNDILGNCFSLFFPFSGLFLKDFLLSLDEWPLQILYTHSKVLFRIRKKG